MKSRVIKFLVGLLIFFRNESYAQYNRKQIDSIFNTAKQATDHNMEFKQVAIAYSASKKIDYKDGIVKGLIIYSDSAYNAGQYDRSFKYSTQAENVSASINNPILIFKIKILKGLCYSRLGFYKQADQTLTSAIPVAEGIINEEDRHYYLTIIYTDLAVNCDRLGDEKARKFWEYKSYTESELLKGSNKYLSDAAITVSNMANRFTMLKQYDSAEFYVNKSLLLANKCTDTYIYKKYYALWVTSIHAGNLYYTKKIFSMSSFYYKNALNAASQIKYTIGLKDAYAGLSKTYAALNEPNKALLYLESSNKLSDSLAQADKDAIRIPLNYIVEGKEQQLATNRNKYLHILFITFFFLLITLSAVFFYRYRFKKEIKLSAGKINELIRKIELNKENQSPSKVQELKDVVQLAVNNDPAFFIKFNEFDTEFSKRLLHLAPGFVAAEVEFCALLRLNFETKEIARYTKVSVRAVEAKKYRIRKKLGIPSDQDINLWMSQV